VPQDSSKPAVETNLSGPPLGEDPIAFYDKGVAQLASEARGVEAVAYKIFGNNVMKSIAFAIDPLHKFRLANGNVSPTTRQRTFTAQGTPAARLHKRKNVSHDCVRLLQTATPDPTDRFPTSCTDTVDVNDTIVHGAQASIFGYIKDTSVKTRDPGVELGCFELWKPSVHSRPRSKTWVDSDLRQYAVAGGNADFASTLDTYTRTGIGPPARITAAAADAIKTAEQTYADQMIAKHALGMLSQSLPESREFNLTREIAELKDLPRILREGLLSIIARDVKRVSLKKRVKSSGHKTQLLSDAYLETVFGWLPMYRAIVGMLQTPARASKRFNRLLAQRGLPTTWRSTRKWVEPYASTPGFTYDMFTNESQLYITSHAIREIELRCMVSATTEFPNVSVPQLRREIMPNLWGLDPHPEDVYNLIPWTWLGDWFVGLGDYVSAWNLVNTDRLLINHGFMTYKSKVTRTTQVGGKTTSTYSVSNTPPPTTVNTVLVDIVHHRSTFEGLFHKRVSLGSAYDAKPTWQLELFSGSQLAILTALSRLRL